MNTRLQVILLGSALAASLLGSYWLAFEYEEGPAVQEEGVAVYVAKPDQLSKVSWDGTDKSITLERRTEGGAHLWVTVTERKEVIPEPALPDAADTDPPDAADTDVQPPEPVIEEEVVQFLGNKAADTLWESFAPFQADRALGTEIRPEYGFDEPFATLTVDRAGDQAVVIVGAATYGDRAHYLKRDDKVFLVKKRVISNILSTDKLMQRVLHPFKMPNVQRLVITQNGQTKSFDQRNPDDRAKSYWAPTDAAETRDAAASNHAPKIVALRAKNYIEAIPEGANEVARLTIEGDDGTSHTATIYQATGDASGWYADASYTRSAVKLATTQAEELPIQLKELFESATPAESSD